jgi:ribosome-associated toxin RatA of RatAB toxin-antitoxin module
MKRLEGRAATTVAASPEACFELLSAVDRYPIWYPEGVRHAEVLERDDAGRPALVQTAVHVAVGPLTRDFEMTMAVALTGGEEVRLTRVPHAPSDPERFEVRWRVHGRASTEIELILEAELDVPRLVPVGAVGERVAQGFVEAASRALEGSSPHASASSA